LGIILDFCQQLLAQLDIFKPLPNAQANVPDKRVHSSDTDELARQTRY